MLLNATFLNSGPPGALPPGVIIAVVSVTMLVVGFLWIRRITRFDEGPSRFRYRKVERGPVSSSRPLMRSGPTFRWIATRAGMTAGLAALILPLVFALLAPNPMGGQADRPWWGHALVATGWLGLVVGNVWLYRIMRGDREPDATSWRYRR